MPSLSGLGLDDTIRRLGARASATTSNDSINGLPTDESVKMAARCARIPPADLIRVAKALLLPNDLIDYEGPRP
jgi:hypothetical protein